MPDNQSVNPSNGHSSDRLDRVERALEGLTIRLDRLTERHEALTQSIELMHHDSEDRHREWKERWQQTEDAIAGLLRIAQAHQKRIEDLEA